MSITAPVVSSYSFNGMNLRVVVLDDVIHFVAKDAAIMLGYANHNQAINDHCRGVAARYPISDSLGRLQEVRIITEADLYRLILRSKLEQAEKFQDWVVEEVLPSIRKTGFYTASSTKVAPTAPSYSSRNINMTERTFEANEAKELFLCYLEIANAIGLKNEQAAVSANIGTRKDTGKDFLDKIDAKFLVEKQSQSLTKWLKANNLAVSAVKANKILEEKGLIEKDLGNNWKLTKEGEKYGKSVVEEINGKARYSINWFEEVLSFLPLETK